MSLYYDAASVLSSNPDSGSLKSIVYNNLKSSQKSKPAHIYALISETSKYDALLKEVIDNAGILALESKLTPLLSLLLVHDQLLSKKKEIAAPTAHPLRQAIERHKARLQAEFTKARLRRRCGTVESLKAQIENERKANVASALQVRWVRLNRLRSTLEAQAKSTFFSWKKVKTLAEVVAARHQEKVYYVDTNIPDLLAVPVSHNMPLTTAYRDGEIILQDKASCFPAHLLLGFGSTQVGDVMDACAAPGNKTTHLASILATNSISTSRSIYACERDSARSNVLSKMVSTAGGDSTIEVLAKQDFLALSPADARFANVTHLLLDPSCSGSGILGRENVPVLALPTDLRADKKNQLAQMKGGQESESKKRKRRNSMAATKPEDTTANSTDNNTTTSTNRPIEAEECRQGNMDPERLSRLAGLQSRIVIHALNFPSAQAVTYSTCSVHYEENEGVVLRILRNDVVRQRGWRVLRREEQVSGMRAWEGRGVRRVANEQNRAGKFDDGRTGENTIEQEGTEDVEENLGEDLTEEERQACIRCTPGDEHATMGFFVCGFVRDVGLVSKTLKSASKNASLTKVPYQSSGVDDEDQAVQETIKKSKSNTKKKTSKRMATSNLEPSIPQEAPGIAHD